MPATGWLCGAQVSPRRFVKIVAGKVQHAQAADVLGVTAGNRPPYGISQEWARGAAGTPWAKVSATETQGGVGGAGVGPAAAVPLAGDVNDEIHVYDRPDQECELEVSTLAATDIDPGAGVVNAGGAITAGDLLTSGNNGIGLRVGTGSVYYGARALHDVALDPGPVNTVTATGNKFLLVVIEKGYQAA